MTDWEKCIAQLQIILAAIYRKLHKKYKDRLEYKDIKMQEASVEYFIEEFNLELMSYQKRLKSLVSDKERDILTSIVVFIRGCSDMISTMDERDFGRWLNRELPGEIKALVQKGIRRSKTKNMDWNLFAEKCKEVVQVSFREAGRGAGLLEFKLTFFMMWKEVLTYLKQTTDDMQLQKKIEDMLRLFLERHMQRISLMTEVEFRVWCNNTFIPFVQACIRENALH